MNDALKQKILERIGFDAEAFYHELHRLWDAKEECGAERMARWQSERDTALVTELLELVERHSEALAEGAKLNNFMPDCGYDFMPGSRAEKLQNEAERVFLAQRAAYADTEATLQRLAGQ